MSESDLRNSVADQILGISDERMAAAVGGWTPLFHQLPAGWLIFRVGPHAEIGYTTNEGWADAPWWVIFDNRGDLTVDVYTESLSDCVDEILTRFGGDPGDGPHQPPNLSPAAPAEQTREQIAAKAIEKRKRKSKK